MLLRSDLSRANRGSQAAAAETAALRPFEVPMRGFRTVEASHEPAPAAADSKPLALGQYTHACGDYASASAVGFVIGVGLVQGRIDPSFIANSWPDDKTCRKVLLLTLAPSGTKAMCCLWT